MSTKKDKFSKKDRYFMSLALNLARDRYGLTGENPSVGCVIVKNNQLISIGQTGLNGVPHAEFNAIKSCKVNLKDSSMYVTLEPCIHHGKTPPCSNLIIDSKIKKIIFSIFDIDKRTRGKFIKTLKSKKILVKSGLLKKNINRFYKSYVYNKSKNLPFVTGKLATSKDNFIYSKRNSKITNQHSNNISHLLRYKNDSILISSKTLNIDNPKLDCRINGLDKFSPKRIILDTNLSINLKSNIFLSLNKKNTLIFYNRGNSNKIKLLKKKGAKLISLPVNENKHFNLYQVLKKIYLFGCRNLLVEGGKNLTDNFLKKKLFNEFYLFKSSNKLGNNGKLNVSSLLKQLNFIYKNKYRIKSFTGKDTINIYS